MCDAVIWMPAAAPECRTAKATTGVGTAANIRITGNPWAARTSAAASANSSEPCRASRPTITCDPLRQRSLRTLATAQVVRRTTARFIPSGPPRRGPRKPAVPKVSGWANRSASSASLHDANSAAVRGSGSCAIHSCATAMARVGVMPVVCPISCPRMRACEAPARRASTDRIRAATDCHAWSRAATRHAPPDLRPAKRCLRR